MGLGGIDAVIYSDIIYEIEQVEEVRLGSGQIVFTFRQVKEQREEEVECGVPRAHIILSNQGNGMQMLTNRRRLLPLNMKKFENGLKQEAVTVL